MFSVHSKFKVLSDICETKSKHCFCLIFSQMVGVEYILLHAQEPILYIIRKQQRQSPTQGEQLFQIISLWHTGQSVYKVHVYDYCSVKKKLPYKQSNELEYQ